MTEVADNTVVDGRYRIVTRIGSGGMADVYLAEDTHLGREVALKVLHRRFAQDSEFVERFRREASSAAGLQHPNVVGVFDRGEHEGTYYIAMEHLPGRTLKDLARQEAPLAQERVIDLGVQILAAAGFAHKRGVIHRDFKPHNVIVDEDGHAKVTDFGIARAGASEMTETGSIMGTAQYLSPEQAQGHAVTSASDLYSIGVMLYEMLVGHVPFTGDSAVSVALKHLSESPVPISQLRPDVNPTLEAVVMAALAKDPEQRWRSADEFAAALEAARGQMEATGNGQDTAGFAAIPAPPAPPTEATAAYAGDGGPVPAEERRRRWPVFTIGLMALLLAGLLAFMALSALLAADKVNVPGVVGDQLVRARAALERAGLDVKAERVRSRAEFDTVVDQDPNSGDEADKGSTVTLQVSNGLGNVHVPSVERLPREQAVKDLNKVDLKVNVDEEPSDRIKEGLAIRTVPREGIEVERGTRIRLFISSGPEKVAVPDVVGQLRDSAEEELAVAGLDVRVDERESNAPKDEVIQEIPGAGTEVAKHTEITIVVSTGKEKVQVPDVVGLDRRTAVSQLREVGLGAVVRHRAVDDQADDGVVIEQRPREGTEVDKGRDVVLIVGEFTAPTPPQVPPATPPSQ